MVKRKKVRDSNFELMRLWAIFSVIMYHSISYYTIFYSPENEYGPILWLPFRTAVTLFVLVSGFYHIRFSVKGLVRLVVKVLVLFVPFELAAMLINGWGGVKSVIGCLMPIAKGPYWYISIYLCLFLVSPLINGYLKDLTVQRRIYLILSLSFISLYLGLPRCVESLDGGKNLLHFVLLYVIGDTLRLYSKQLKEQIKLFYLVLAFLLINFGQIIFFLNFHDTALNSFRLFVDRDNGLVLMLNAVVTFLLFSRIKLKNNAVNVIASSVLVMYIVQQEPTLRFHLSSAFSEFWNPAFAYNTSGIEDSLKLVGYLTIRAFFFMAVAFLIDRVLSPLWKLSEEFATRKWGKIDTYIAE